MTRSAKKKKRQASQDDNKIPSEARSDFQTGFWSRLLQSRAFLIFLVLTAYLLRSILLDIKPPHFDEGINGNFIARVWRDGFYTYDPTNFHGPLYFYFLQFADLLFGHSIAGYRFITGLISLACVIVIYMHRRFFGAAAVIAALVVAISPAFVFYSRYAIHESLFILCHVIFSYGFFMWQEERSRRSVALMVIGVFASFTVKETFFIFFGTWLIAIACAKLAQKFLPRQWPEPFLAEDPPAVTSLVGKSDENGDDDGDDGDDIELASFWRRRASPNDTLILVCYASFVPCPLLTGFFLNPKGYQDMFAAFLVWTKTGTGGSGQEKVFTYWLDLMWRYEWPALLGLIVSIPLAFVLGVRERILTLVAFGTWLAYSIIPYKTPWLILNLIWPLAFVFGFALQALPQLFGESLRWRPLRWTGALAGLPTLVVSAYTMYRINFVDFVDQREPYVYVQSTASFKRVIDTVEARVKLRPEARNLRLYALVRDPWPLPWVFSLYPNLFWGQPEDADFKDAAVVLIDEPKRAITEKRLSGKFWRMPFQMRDSYEPGFAYFAFEDFKGLVPSDTAIFEREDAKAATDGVSR